MPRPYVEHDGFLVPNASTVSNPRMAEPDRIDFNTVAHALWGVIEGCEVTVSQTTASVTAGHAVVNGLLVKVATQPLYLDSGGSQDRFDLIAVDQGGTLHVIIGAYSNDPVFPDPGKEFTVLAAVFAPATQSNFTDNVIDKRKFIQKALLTKIDPGDMLVRNTNGAGNHFTITGGGLTSWEGDTTLWRSAPATLRVQSKLSVDDTITAGGKITAGSVEATDTINGSNLLTGTSTPPESPPVTVKPGSLYQNSVSGKVYIWQKSKWQELASTESVAPVGTFLTSLEKPAVMELLGWVALNGQTVTEATHDKLFTIDALLRYVTSGTEAAHDRVMKLPDLTGVMPMIGYSGVGVVNTPWPNNRVALNLGNLPRHKHSTTMAPAGSGPIRGVIGRSGLHGHAIDGGAHSHPVSDPGHKHYMVDGGNGGYFICSAWGGQNKLDALFNDRNHTWSVDAREWTNAAFSNISIGSAGSEHWHNVSQDGYHDHPLTIDNAPEHVHSLTEQEVGSSAPVDITPAHIVLYAYVRS